MPRDQSTKGTGTIMPAQGTGRAGTPRSFHLPRRRHQEQRALHGTAAGGPARGEQQAQVPACGATAEIPSLPPRLPFLVALQPAWVPAPPLPT